MWGTWRVTVIFAALSLRIVACGTMSCEDSSLHVRFQLGVERF